MKGGLGRFAALLHENQNRPVLGPELFRNAGWAGGGSWTATSGFATPGGGVCAATAATGALSQTVAPSGIIAIGKRYRVAYILVSVSGGDVRFQFTGGSNDNGASRTANGVYSEDILITQTITSYRFINAGSAFTGTICAISLREILT